MGKWNRRYVARPRKRNYQDYDWSPPRDEPCPDPETEVWQDNVPMWEKKFCYLVGRMPWKKVLSTKNFMHCHSNVLTWNDSAGEEAFNYAKKRFWDEINGVPCETQLPNPDMYIDEINWNPHIDPDLVRELDQAYFNPDDKYYLPSWKRKNGWPKDGGNPWDVSHVQSSSENDQATGWNACNYTVDDTSKLTKHNDPWESHNSQVNAVSRDNAWGGSWNKSWDSKPNNCSYTTKNWGAENNSWRREGSGWPDRGDSSSNWNQKTGELFKPSCLHNSYRSQDFASNQKSSVQNGRGSQWGPKRSDTYNYEGRDPENNYRGGKQYHAGRRKREGPDQYAANYKGPRLQRGDYQSSRYWTEDKNTRPNFGGQWS